MNTVEQFVNSIVEIEPGVMRQKVTGPVLTTPATPFVIACPGAAELVGAAVTYIGALDAAQKVLQ